MVLNVEMMFEELIRVIWIVRHETLKWFFCQVSSQ